MNWTLALLRGLIGVLFLLGIAWLMSSDRKRIKWRIVGAGLLLQTVLAVLVLKVGWIGAIFDWIGQGFVAMLNLSKEAAVFVFGPLGPPSARRRHSVRIVALSSPPRRCRASSFFPQSRPSSTISEFSSGWSWCWRG